MTGAQPPQQANDPETRRSRWSFIEDEMFLDDAAWIVSMGLSNGQHREWGSPFAYAMGTHMARVAYEGWRLLATRNQFAAAAVKLRLSDEIEAARHALKLVDDKNRKLEEFAAGFNRIAAEHAAGLQADAHFAVMTYRRHVITTTSVAEFQGMVDFVEMASGPEDGGSARKFGLDIGELIPTLTRELDLGFPPIAPLRLPRGRAPRECVIAREDYLASRFFPEFSPGIKDVLLLVEAAVNSVLHVFERTGEVFPNPLFRARFLIAFHALDALSKLLSLHPELGSRWRLRKLASIVASASAERLRGLRVLRNLCMHYGIPPQLENLDAQRPGYGLVEATASDATFRGIYRDITTTLDAISHQFALWRDGR